MNDKTAVLIGATGLIGSHLLNLLQDDDHYSEIRLLVRRPLPVSHPKLKVIVINFEDDRAFSKGIEGSDTVFVAVGTTQKKVKGDLNAYRKVDYDIPVNAAHYCSEAGVKQFLLVSSVGASSRSNNFYLKLKGEVEDEISRMPITSINIFRPSMLLGKRNESRPMETIAQAISKPLGALFPSKYKPIKAFDVARAMIAAGKQNSLGYRVYHYREMMALLA